MGPPNPPSRASSITPSRASSLTPSRASSITTLDTSTSAASLQQNAALLGASLAFRPRPPPRQLAATPTYAGGSSSTGALSAATTANIRRATPSPNRSIVPSPLPTHAPLSGSLEASDTAAKYQPAIPNPSQPQHDRPSVHNRSHCQQAALLAAARAKPTALASAGVNACRPRTGTVQRPAVAPKPRRLSEHFKTESNVGVISSDKPTDSTPIAPTNSLVSLFEQRAKAVNDSKADKRPEPVVIKPSRRLSLKSPKPVISGGITSMFQLELEEAKKNEQIGREPIKQDRHDSVPAPSGGDSSDDSFASASEDLNLDRNPPIMPRSAGRTVSQSPSQSLRTGLQDKRRPQQAPPSTAHYTASRAVPIEPLARSNSAASDAYSVSSAPSLRSIAAQFNHAHPRRMTPLRTGDDLANAMVASSLASSRAPSPTKLEPPPIPSRRKKGHHKLPFSRTPSPEKAGMLHTLRNYDGASSSEAEDGKHPYRKHQRKRLIRKHPNKHHEGERKRWRDAITERERKRYEGVWAANKGLHYSYTHEEQTLMHQQPDHPQVQDLLSAVSDQVSNIIARDIWGRSRLPEPTLETVWDLVDHDSVGRLQKEEFVVGMWLIDQRLKGRKLPVKVTESVWTSVRSVGIKVRKKA